MKTSRLDWTISKTAMWTAVLNTDPDVVLVARTKEKLMRKINLIEKSMAEPVVELNDLHSEK